MSTNLSGNTLTLGNTGLNEETLKAIRSYYYVPDNCTAGTTVILDGIECVCVATGVTIQGSTLTRIAVDKNHDLGYYQKYIGITQNSIVNGSDITKWRWGGYGTFLGNTSVEVGYGLRNTINCLANAVNYTKGAWSSSTGDGCPWLWQGVSDFRSSHSDKWFVPSLNELINYVAPNRSNLTFNSAEVVSNIQYWSSSEGDSGDKQNTSYNTKLNNPNRYTAGKYLGLGARLCRAF